MKQVYFCDVYDGSSCKNLQVVLTKEKRQAMPMMDFGASVMAAGKVAVAPKGHLELVADDFQLIGKFRVAQQMELIWIELFQASAIRLRPNIHL